MPKERDLSSIEDVIALIAPIISHEVRNPLAIIGNSSFFIKSKLSKDGIFDPKIERHLSIIEIELQHANDVFTQIISYARMPAAQPKPLRLGPLLEAAAAGFTGVTLAPVPDGTSVTADADLAKTALRSVIENAVQSAGDGEKKDGQGKVTVAVSVKGRRVIIEVSDSGPGIPEEARARLFAPFNTTKPRGIGMGLAYARKALERQAGKIELAKSKSGALLRISLPAASQAPA
ncbi:MAG: HAMP domain-containing sensor histidine kinase [Elusimicrobiota bacterium]